MKLRTSFFNPTVFKKDITRFAPAWVLYTVGLFMMLSVCLIDNSEYYRAYNLADSVAFMAVINLCYGLLNSQLLFGDLFNARHCNALHATHLRRECWFCTHMVSGLLFSLVPNLLMSLVALMMLGSGWQVALWWLLASELQYLFFFGLAVFSALCVGNRFAMVLVYGIVNFFSLIVYWFYYTIYQPLLYGVHITQEAFTRYCPTWTMIENYEIIDVQRWTSNTEYYPADYEGTVLSVSANEGWGYLAICAAIGVALAVTALLLYRRRKLESAGDFMAVPALEPVFQVLYTMSMAAFFQVFAELFGLGEYIFLALGLVIGFFTGRMLLKRTIRVFQPKSFLHFAILAVAFIATMLLTWLDPMGITRYIPDTASVQAVYLSTNYDPTNTDVPALTTEADIDMVRNIHQLILDGEISVDVTEQESRTTYLSFYYVLDNGTTVSRSYKNVYGFSKALQQANTILTRPEYVLGADIETILQNGDYLYLYDYSTDQSLYLDDFDEIAEGLLRAIEADCLSGNMAQSWAFHGTKDYIAAFLEYSLPLEIGAYSRYYSIYIYSSAVNTLAYIQEYITPLNETGE